MMSGNKYADLPDIDTAPDIYETEDVFPTAQPIRAESSDDEGAPSRNANKKKVPPPTKEELDMTGLISPDEATRRFRRAERRQRSRSAYVYPPSADSSPPPVDHSGVSRPIPLSQRLRLLNAELTSLENELADPSNPLLQKEREEDNVDPGELIKDLVVVRGRLDKIRKKHEGRARLIGTILGKDVQDSESEDEDEDSEDDSESPGTSKMRNMIDIDKRVGELEKLIGSSNATLDETSPLPPPLLPQITRLNGQLALLTQPRHIDSVSRRLKLLLSDLDRASSAQQHRRHQGNSLMTPIPENMLPILLRLGPTLPQIPHILTRLRTLSVLHTSAGEFQTTLEDLEKEHRKVHEALTELDSAVSTVEKSLEDNKGVVNSNVANLEDRVESLLQRLEELSRERPQKPD